MCCFLLLSTIVWILYCKMCFFCELPTCVWILYYETCYYCLPVSESSTTNMLLLPTCVCILYYEICYHCLPVSESCTTKYTITDSVSASCMIKINVLLLPTCVESCMTKCAVAAYLCLNLSGRKNFRCRFSYLRDGIQNVRNKNQWLLHSLHPFQFSERYRSHICHRRKYFF